MAYHNNPRIVTNGLVLCLDANDKKSAPSEDLPIKNGCVTWLDGADDSVFTYSSGTLVSEWRDKSGNANHVYQSTTASQPTRNTTYSGSGSNAKDVVVFDGTDDSLSSTNSLDLSAGYTMFVLVRGSVGSSDAGVISINNSLSSGITIHNGSLAYFYFGSGSYATTQSIATSQTNILTKVWTGSTSGDRISYKNGTQGTSNGTMSNTNATGVLRLGQQSTYLNGFIGEVIIYNRDLGTAELEKVHGYLSNKWGNTVSGDSWFDLCRSHNALVNGPFYNSAGDFDFDGSNDYVDLGTNVVYKSTAGWTVSTWVKYHNVPGAYNNTTSPGNFIGADTINESSWYWSVLTGKLALWDKGNGVWKYGNTTLSADTWYHATLVSDHNNTHYYCYLNGEDDMSSAWSSHNGSWSDNNGLTIRYIGQGSSGNPRRVDGNIATTHVWSRALTDAEILQNYEAHKSRFGL